MVPVYRSFDALIQGVVFEPTMAFLQRSNGRFNELIHSYPPLDAPVKEFLENLYKLCQGRILASTESLVQRSMEALYGLYRSSKLTNSNSIQLIVVIIISAFVSQFTFMVWSFRRIKTSYANGNRGTLRFLNVGDDRPPTTTSDRSDINVHELGCIKMMATQKDDGDKNNEVPFLISTTFQDPVAVEVEPAEYTVTATAPIYRRNSTSNGGKQLELDNFFRELVAIGQGKSNQSIFAETSPAMTAHIHRKSSTSIGEAQLKDEIIIQELVNNQGNLKLGLNDFTMADIEEMRTVKKDYPRQKCVVLRSGKRFTCLNKLVLVEALVCPTGLVHKENPDDENEQGRFVLAAVREHDRFCLGKLKEHMLDSHTAWTSIRDARTFLSNRFYINVGQFWNRNKDAIVEIIEESRELTQEAALVTMVSDSNITTSETLVTVNKPLGTVNDSNNTIRGAQIDAQEAIAANKKKNEVVHNALQALQLCAQRFPPSIPSTESRPKGARSTARNRGQRDMTRVASGVNLRTPAYDNVDNADDPNSTIAGGELPAGGIPLTTKKKPCRNCQRKWKEHKLLCALHMHQFKALTSLPATKADD
jgi:hypothetical protein